jgi:hypothetical protein
MQVFEKKNTLYLLVTEPNEDEPKSIIVKYSLLKKIHIFFTFDSERS